MENVTIIITTSVNKDMDNCENIMKVFESIYNDNELRGCGKILVFDKIPTETHRKNRLQ